MIFSTLKVEILVQLQLWRRSVCSPTPRTFQNVSSLGLFTYYTQSLILWFYLFVSSFVVAGDETMAINWDEKQGGTKCESSFHSCQHSSSLSSYVDA
uniref:Uncharacterized protein n=1 Tax=Lactuca sativa TaxID=4236 RepID=A0A9R1WSZ2_LACSA|nr:hypothetical protein LSAT_V11C900489120 [Lactuca sativa]